MWICLRLTGIATLLIGLQLFSSKMVDAKVEIGVFNNTSSNQSFVTSNTFGSQRLNQVAPSSTDFEAPDNGGPDTTRGCGTR
jgi:hypothetical protein